MKTTVDRLVDDYLKRLSHELRDLPRTRRRELRRLDDAGETRRDPGRA